MNILSDRSVFKIRGEESFNFLQSVITADISPLKKGKAVASCLLSPQGRILYDFLLYPELNQTDFSCLVDCHHSEKFELMKKLNMYKLRSKVLISDNNELCILINQKKNDGFFSDPRHPKLPFRKIIEKDISDNDFPEDNDFHSKRLDLCVAEGPSEIIRGEALPLDYWMDKTSHVSFTKGCFIGQEVTARVYHRNKIRRRLITIKSQETNFDTKSLPDKNFRFINYIGKFILLLAPVNIINEFVESKQKPELKWYNKYIKFNYYF